MRTLETERLILRGFDIKDLKDLHQYAKSPNVGPNAGWKPHENIEETEKILRIFIEQDEVWAIVYEKENKVIGSVGLHKDYKRDGSNTKMLGYVLSEEYWGSGIAVEAAKEVIKHGFEEMKLDMISVYHFTFNERSKRVIEKCGFKYEGVIRKATEIFNGNVYDDACYSILKEEYFGI